MTVTISMHTPPSADPSPSLRVFVVENHPDTLKYLLMYLESEGYTVGSAFSVEKALENLSGQAYDVLISDIGLPDGDGWGLLQTLTERGHRPPYAIAMSGFGMNADQARSRASGFRHHLLKPFPPAELDAMLAEAEQEKRAR